MITPILALIFTILAPSDFVTIDFESAPVGLIASGLYSESNYTFADVGHLSPQNLEIFGTAEGYESQVIQVKDWGRKIHLTQSQGETFDLISFDYAAGRWDNTADSVVTATFSNGLTASVTVAATSKNRTTETVNWNQLASVEFASSEYCAFDNFVVRSSGSSPEPATPMADAGENKTVLDFDEDGVEMVTLDGSGSSDSDGTIVSQIWSENDTTLSTELNPTLSFAVGIHTLTLTVTDNTALTDSATVTITVNPGSILEIPALLQDVTVRAGFCAIVGCEDVASISESQLAGKFVVQCVSADGTQEGSMRTALEATGSYGTVSVTRVETNRLPYVDHLVNALVVNDTNLISRAEAMRVVAPYGVAFFNEDGTWDKVTKAFPQEMDEWSQNCHDASGSRLSEDELVAPPTRLQWLAQETYDREQLLQLLSAEGRNFYTFKNGKIVARDAFNGTRLWEQEDCGSPWAITEGALCTTILGKFATVDAATGAIQPTDVKFSNACALDQGIIYSANGAYDIQLGTFLWQNAEPKYADAKAPLVFDGKLVITTPSYGTNPEMICRDATTGVDLWRMSTTNGVPDFCYRGKLLARGELKQLVETVGGREYTTDIATTYCYDLETGALIWTVEFYLPTHHGMPTMFPVGDTLWCRPGSRSAGFAQGEFWRLYDLNTGAVIKEIQTIQAMHRCFEPRATTRFILGTGIDYLDYTTDEVYSFTGARGDCSRGTTPANGMLYQFPNMCMCMGQIDGVSGILSHSMSDPAESTLALSDLLETGPAFGTIQTNGVNEVDTWRTLRANQARLGSNQSQPPIGLGILWETQHVVQPSSPVAAGGSAYVALRDTHSVASFSTTDGQSQWVYYADGSIDSPPTLTGNAVVFGDEEGWVYVLRASDGELAWRFRAAPEKRTILNENHPASAWPLQGSLLVEHGIIYAAAGHHNELDGGLFTYALDLQTGSRVWQKRIIRDGVTQPVEQSEVGHTGNNLLSSDGTTLYMELLHLDLQNGDIVKSYESGKLFFTKGWPTDVIWGGPQGFLLDLSRDHYYSGHSSSDWHWGNVRANMLAVDGDFGYGMVTIHGRDYERYYDDKPMFLEGPTVIFCADQAEGDKGWGDYIFEETPIWKVTLPEESIARSIIKTADQVIVASQTPTGSGVILQLDPTTGAELGRLALTSPPRWDGLAASGNQLYVITEDNKLLCLGTL